MANNITVVCPGCKKELAHKNISGEFKLGANDSTVTIYLEVYCYTCNAPSFFTFVHLTDMVNLEEASKEVSNG
jgi:hypothetical protein